MEAKDFRGKHAEDFKGKTRDETGDDKKFIESGKNEDDKKKRKALIDWVKGINGLAAQLVPGAQKSYIPQKNYYQKVKGLDGTLGQVVEMAYNWEALGKNKAALYGAAVRWGARELMSEARECTVHEMKHDGISDETLKLVGEYMDMSVPRSEQVSFWTVNALNVVALAGALQLSIGHHYDAKNVKAQIAVVGALGQADDVVEDDIRSLFYLSVHPVTLPNIEGMRKLAANPEEKGFTEAVRVRALGVPAGFASLSIALAAIEAMRTEPFFQRIYAKFGQEFDKAADIMARIKLNPTAFHVNAPDYGVHRMYVDEKHIVVAKVIGIAYAKACVGGTLAKAASLKKFADAHSKEVKTWMEAFAADAESRKASLDALLA